MGQVDGDAAAPQLPKAIPFTTFQSLEKDAGPEFMEIAIDYAEAMRNARDLGKKHSYNEVVERLSPEVKKDCVLTMSLKTLQVSDALSLCRLPGTSQPSPCNLPAPHDRAAV